MEQAADAEFVQVEARKAAIWLRLVIKGWWYLPLIHWVLPNLMPLPRSLKVKVPRWLRYMGKGLSAGGTALTLWSIWTLVRHGDGTPNPSDPPRLFVQHGPYRFCRNPMEQGNILQLVGRTLTDGGPRMALASVVFTVATHFWVVNLEEPGLVRQFGAPYESYRRHVPRWGWRKPSDRS